MGSSTPTAPLPGPTRSSPPPATCPLCNPSSATWASSMTEDAPLPNPEGRTRERRGCGSSACRIRSKGCCCTPTSTHVRPPEPSRVAQADFERWVSDVVRRGGSRPPRGRGCWPHLLRRRRCPRRVRWSRAGRTGQSSGGSPGPQLDVALVGRHRSQLSEHAPLPGRKSTYRTGTRRRVCRWARRCLCSSSGSSRTSGTATACPRVGDAGLRRRQKPFRRPRACRRLLAPRVLEMTVARR